MLSSIEDKVIASKMRSDYHEQFKSLVRTHLSFVLELKAEELDMPNNEYIYYEKGEMKKWIPTTKVEMKGCTSTNVKTISNITSKQLTDLRKLKQYILIEDNIKKEGVFRRTGAVSRQNKLRSLLSKQENIDLNVYSVHDCTTVFKSVLGDLAEPLLTDAHYSIYCQITDWCKKNGKKDNGKNYHHILNVVQTLLLLLPEESYQLLEDIIEMLNTCAKYEKYNKMSPDTLATLFSPHLVCPRNLPPKVLHYVSQNMTPVISFLIAQGAKIFNIPSKLATDIRVYYEAKCKRTTLPADTLDKSISPIKTVYTFVDREKTKEENDSNRTEEELAKLYAHIQGLPETPNKIKLIKDFNKYNGQGAPVLHIKNSHRRIKPIGLLKRRFFRKSISPNLPKDLHPKSTTNVDNSTIDSSIQNLNQLSISESRRKKK